MRQLDTSHRLAVHVRFQRTSKDFLIWVKPRSWILMMRTMWKASLKWQKITTDFGDSKGVWGMSSSSKRLGWMVKKPFVYTCYARGRIQCNLCRRGEVTSSCSLQVGQAGSSLTSSDGNKCSSSCTRSASGPLPINPRVWENLKASLNVSHLKPFKLHLYCDG